MEHTAQGSYGSSVFGETKNPAGHSPGQPAVVAPVLSRSVGLGNLQRCLPARQPCCDSVNVENTST